MRRKKTKEKKKEEEAEEGGKKLRRWEGGMERGKEGKETEEISTKKG